MSVFTAARRWGAKKWLLLDREERLYLHSHNTDYEVFTNRQMHFWFVLLQLQITTSMDILMKFIIELTLINSWMILCTHCALTFCVNCVQEGRPDWSLLNIKIWVRIKNRDKNKQPPANQHPRSAAFQTNMMNNFYFTIWCLLLPPMAIQTKEALKKWSNMVLRVYSDHTICFLKWTFKTLLRAVPTALSARLTLTSRSPLYYFPSV